MDGGQMGGQGLASMMKRVYVADNIPMPSTDGPGCRKDVNDIVKII